MHHGQLYLNRRPAVLGICYDLANGGVAMLSMHGLYGYLKYYLFSTALRSQVSGLRTQEPGETLLNLVSQVGLGAIDE